MKEQITKKTLASLALFRRLYDEDKRNIFTILSEFIKEIIHNKGLVTFNLTQIKDFLRTEYNFSIPEYVVSTALGKICNKNNGQYSLMEKEIYLLPDNNFSTNIEEITENNNIIINKLVSYVDERIKKVLSDDEKEKLMQSFCDFLIEETTDLEYAEYISAFILDLKKDDNFTKQLNTIKEGVVLYTGISYNNNLGEVGNWNTELTIYVEQEILFHLAGYNGTLYKDLFEDFYSLVREINERSYKKIGKALIKIKYFPETLRDINKFFAIAERIVDKIETLNVSNQAMCEITNGCFSSSDVIAKKAHFDSLLKEYSVTLVEDKNYYGDNNKQYNIELTGNSIKDLFLCNNSFNKDITETAIADKLKFLNYVNIDRKGNNHCGFENVQYILLSGSATTLKLAFSSEFKTNGDVPFATDLNFITNRLWFKLNKGFGTGNYPKNFDIITKAQIVLSSQITESVSKEFERLKIKRNNGDLSHDDEVASLAELKSRMHKPEEISQRNTTTILDAIQISDIEKHLREREIERRKAKQESEKNIKLEEQIAINNGFIEKTNQEKLELSKSLCDKKKDEIKQISVRIDKMEKRKYAADKVIINRMNLIRYMPLAFIVIIMICIGLLVYYKNWEDHYYFMEFIPVILAYSLFAITGKKINIIQYINVDIKQKIVRKIYEERDVNLCELKDLKDTKEQKEKQL